MKPIRMRRVIDEAGADAVLAAAEQAAREQGLRVVMAVVDPWGELVALRRSIVVGGAHGKTTTAAMIAYVLRELGRDPAFLVGAEVPHSELGRVGGDRLLIGPDLLDVPVDDLSACAPGG